ncbi:f-actin capping protein beta subunit [Diplodia corticola]|uniref:F-actin-capping protein subunit beta n=1 Tax=Diplodia corticola TaxID=236234 RepID=A0A1J9QJ18_9PEZI|nr:f-actin capping protein beta subunit [Diplodia corticola]OJD28854.1 f-actin capping protein beta subunit [Diplodia corticola]
MSSADPFDSALDLLRRLNPKDTATNVDRLCQLAPSLTEDLLESVDVPLAVKRCPKTKRDFLCCDYNRDGDSWRSPWSNEFEPPLEDGEGVFPSERVRKMELKANEAFDVYRELYYEGGISSVYLWDMEDGFAGCVLLKKSVSPSSKTTGGWDSIHVFEALDRARTAHYKLTSTVILNLGTDGNDLGSLDLSGNMVRQVEQDMPVDDDTSHVANIGRMVEDMELKMRNLLQEVYFGKAKDVVGDLRSIASLSETNRDRATHKEMISSMGGGRPAFHVDTIDSPQTARPTCSNCRKWGIPCDYTNRLYAAERTFGVGSADEYTDRNSWAVEPSTNALGASNFPFQDAVHFQWQSKQSSAQHALTVPDMLSGLLDTNAHMDVSSEVPLTIPDSGGDATNSAGVDFAALFDCSTEIPDLNQNQAFDAPISGSGSLTDVAIPSLCLENGFPSESLLLELVDIYFAHHQVFLPFLHKSQYQQRVKRFRRESPDRQDAALLYAVLAIAAASHPDPTVRDRRLEWFAKAKQLSGNTEKRYASLQEIQASLCICLLAWTTGDYPLCWLSIGTAWRQAVTLGLNRIDGGQCNLVQEGSLPKCALEKEEQRRTIWTLFLMDRGMAFPCGWPHAIDDRQFMVNLPVDEDVFQSADDKTPVLNNSTMPFTRNLRKLTTSTPTEGSSTVYQTILKAYILLGRITEHVNSLEASSDPDGHFLEFQQLDTELSRFKLSLPRSTTTLRSSSVREATHIFWLNAIVGILVILLHHRPDTAASKPPQSSSAVNTPVSETRNSIDGFEYCVAATENLSRMIQDATKVSVDALINPHIGSSLYGCGRTLALHYVAGGGTKSEEEIRSGIDMYLLLFDRVADVYPTLGTKFRNGMRYTLAQAPQIIREMKADGARGMLSKCGDWAGATPQATLQNLTAAFSR